MPVILSCSLSLYRADVFFCHASQTSRQKATPRQTPSRQTRLCHGLRQALQKRAFPRPLMSDTLSAITIAGLVIGFAVPVFAQQKETVDPQLAESRPPTD